VLAIKGFLTYIECAELYRSLLTDRAASAKAIAD